MYDLARVTKEIKEICEKANVPADIPIKLNGRLTRTLGQVCFRRVEGGSVCYTTKIEFSKQLLETATDESIRRVIEHECAHHIILCRTGVDHGHDALFKKVCKEIGTVDNIDSPSTNDIEYTVDDSKIFKYQVYCPQCEAFIGKFHKMCPTIRGIKDRYCAKCKCRNLQVIQNW